LFFFLIFLSRIKINCPSGNTSKHPKTVNICEYSIYFYLAVMGVLEEPGGLKTPPPYSFLLLPMSVYHTPPASMYFPHATTSIITFLRLHATCPPSGVRESDYNKIISYYSHFFFYNGFSNSSWKSLKSYFPDYILYVYYGYMDIYVAVIVGLYIRWAKSTHTLYNSRLEKEKKQDTPTS